jgi:septum site-determining protein MinC
VQIELPKLDKRVVIKGYRTGIGIFFDEDSPLSDLLQDLASNLQRSNAFFAGAPVTLHVGRREMTYRDFMALRDLLVERHGLMIAQVHAELPGTRQAAERLGLKLGGAPGAPAVRPVPQAVNPPAPAAAPQQAAPPAAELPRADGGLAEAPLVADTLTVRQTLRSGQRIAFPGHVLVLGDVNSGAEVVADGDIVVFGALRGLAHAGARGDAGAVIIALGIQPPQLRIGGVISRGPTAPSRRDQAQAPEIARVEGGSTIVVETFRGRL